MKTFNIVITGTSSGIGNKLAYYYIGEGYNVFGCSRRESTISHLRYKHFKLDVSNEDDIINMVRSIDKIDILINNAGIASMNHSCLTPYDTVKNIFSTNVFGTFLFSREVSKAMKGGKIINFSSLAVKIDLEGEMIYAASKAAIEKMTTILSKELSSFGITVNAIAPSPTKTDLIKNIPQEKINKIIEMSPSKKMCDIGDIIDTINFFINSNVTGQIIYL